MSTVPSPFDVPSVCHTRYDTGVFEPSPVWTASIRDHSVVPPPGLRVPRERVDLNATRSYRHFLDVFGVEPQCLDELLDQLNFHGTDSWCAEHSGFTYWTICTSLSRLSGVITNVSIPGALYWPF